MFSKLYRSVINLQLAVTCAISHYIYCKSVPFIIIISINPLYIGTQTRVPKLCV